MHDELLACRWGDCLPLYSICVYLSLSLSLSYIVCPAGGQNHLYLRESTGDSTVFPARQNPSNKLIPCRTMGSIFHEAGVRWVDFFSLDVEGAELAVLETIDWREVGIGVLLVENLRFDRVKLEQLLVHRAGMVRMNSSGVRGSIPDCTLQRKRMKLNQFHIHISDVWVHPSLRDDICA